MQLRIQLHSLRKFLPWLGALVALTSAAQAQSETGGVLGQRFVGAHADLVDFENLTDYGCSAGVGMNLPVLANVDVGLGLAYGWLNTHGQSVRERTVNASVVWHASTTVIKPFVGAGIGYDWVRDYFSWTRLSDNAGRWGAVIGVEVPVQGVVVTPSLGYSDWFNGHWAGTVSYGVEVSYWFTRSVGGYAGVIHNDFTGDNGSSSVYRAGLRLKF